MHYRPFPSIYDLYYPRFYPTYTEVALDVADAENRVLSRQVNGLVRENIRLRTQILEKDYIDLDKETGVSIGLSRGTKQEKEKYSRQTQYQKNVNSNPKKEQKQLHRDYSFGSLQKTEKKDKPTIQTRSNYRHASLQFKQKPFEEHQKKRTIQSPKRYKYGPSSTFIDGLNEDKLNPERNSQKNVQSPKKKRQIPPSVHLMSQVKSEQYYNEQQAHTGKKNNLPYLYENERQEDYSPYKKFKGNYTSEKKKNQQEETVMRQSTTNKKQFLNIFSKALESVKQQKQEKEQQKE